VVDEIKHVMKTNFLIEKGVPFLSKIYLISLLFNILAIYSVFYVYTNPPEADYYSTSVNGNSSPLIPLTQPNTSDSVVTQWANLASIAAFTYDFVNYESQLEEASDYFTRDGWESYLQSLEESNNLNTVISKKLVVSAVALSTPLILKKGFINGIYSWRIQLPILVTYQSASDVTQMKLIINLLMTRISTRENYKGVGIEQFSTTAYYGDLFGANI
jgi:intracellular multiplication protein IcmL